MYNVRAGNKSESEIGEVIYKGNVSNSCVENK